MELCDFCKSEPSENIFKIGSERCAICGKWLCEDKNCKGKTRDDYFTTKHFPRLIYGKQFPTICVKCWELAQSVSDTKIKNGVKHGGSGSIWAVKLGEFAWKVALEKWKEVEKEILDEIKRLIKIAKEQKKEKTKIAELEKKFDMLKRKVLKKDSVEDDLPF